MRTTLAIVTVIIVVLVLANWIGSRRLNRSTARLENVLIHSLHRTAPDRVDFAALSALPEPVGRYFRRVLRDGQPLIRVALLNQMGELRTKPQSSRWLGFEARQLVVPSAPGFLWDARVTIAPFLHVRVRDAYIEGKGSGLASLLSALPIGADSGTPELNSGALHRYLAEAVWYPTALLPCAALKWSSLNRSKALATLTDSGITVSLEFWFNDAGEVTGVYSPGRWGRFNGEYRQVAWEGHFRNYHQRDGMWIPSEGEVGWYSSSEWQSVWRGTLAESRYEIEH